MEALDRGEMLARVRVALRQGAARSKPGIVVAGDVRIDLERRLVTRGGEPVHLTKREFDLLRVLASSPGHVLSHQRIAKLAWGARGVDDTARLRVYINQLRQKLEADPSAPRIIVTEAGIGYRLRSNSDAQ